MRIEEYRLAVGSPGAGKHRGGYGVERIWGCLSPLTVSAHLNSLTARPPGLRGGHNAANTALLFNHADENEWLAAGEMFGKVSSGKFSNIQLEAGDRILLRTPGGAGYGDPLDRDPELVEQDVWDELLDIEDAAADYGVVIMPAGLKADLAVTERLREEIRNAAA